MVTESIREAHELAAERLLAARASVRAAFDGLGSGLTFDDLVAYIERDFHAKSVFDAPTLDIAHARIVGLAAATAITVVEADRLGRE